MGKIIDAEILEKEIESINRCYGSGDEIKENRVLRRTYSKENVLRLQTLEMSSDYANHMNEKEGESPNWVGVSQYLYYGMDLFMSSLTDSSKKSFMKYLKSEEGENEFHRHSWIRGYFLNEFNRNGNPRKH